MVEDKTRKELLEEPDPFIVFIGRVVDFAKKYQQQIVMTAMAVFIGAVVISGVVYFKRQTDDKAAALLGKAIASYSKITHKTTGIQKTPTVAEYEEARKIFKEVMDKYGSTGSGKAALLNYADLSYLVKDYDQAIKSYEKALNDFGGQPEFKNLILNGLASSYEEKQDLENAIKYFDLIVSGNNALMKDQALFNLALIYEKQGKKDKEVESYKRIISEFPDSTYAQIAKEKIAG